MNTLSEQNNNMQPVKNEEKPVLLGMPVLELSELLARYPSFTAKQISSFLYDGKPFSEMTSVKKELREWLEINTVGNPVVIKEVFKSKSGAKKYLYELTDGNLIEGVFMPHDYGNTLCISTQIGCRMGCKFCASGLDGLMRNLTSAEMLGQVVAANAFEGGNSARRSITNIVLMGSGEPFDNYENVLDFLTKINSEEGLNVSERNISLSTSGLADKITEFADSGHKVTLSISLHAPFDKLRGSLMPINNKYNIESIINAAKYYFEKTGRRVIFEYTLISGENDSDACALELKKITKGFPAHINLIRLNTVKERAYKPTAADSAERFLSILTKLGVSATIRKSLGDDIEGACGQLRRRYAERTRPV